MAISPTPNRTTTTAIHHLPADGSSIPPLGLPTARNRINPETVAIAATTSCRPIR